MKELDKAIINNDIDRITLLIRNDIDCRGAVLIHLKDALVPERFSEEHLESRGIILNEAGLDGFVDLYTRDPKADLRNETYIRRFYRSLHKAIKSWQLGTMKNKDVLSDWDGQSISFLSEAWYRKETPSELNDFFQAKMKAFVRSKLDSWRTRGLKVDEDEKLTEVISKAVHNHFWLSSTGGVNNEAEYGAAIVQQIDSNIIEQTAQYFLEGDNDDVFVQAIETFVYDRLIKQIYDESINNEPIRDSIETEKERLIEGKVVATPMPKYKRAVKGLLTEKKQDLKSELKPYLLKALVDFVLPGKFKTIITPKAIDHLFSQHKGDLPFSKDGVDESLSLMIHGVVERYYEGLVNKGGDFFDGISEDVFSEYLDHWREGELSEAENEYLEGALLSDQRLLLEKIEPYASQAKLFTQVQMLISVMADRIQALEGEVFALRQEKKSDEDYSDGTLLNTRGLLKFGVLGNNSVSSTINENEEETSEQADEEGTSVELN